VLIKPLTIINFSRVLKNNIDFLNFSSVTLVFLKTFWKEAKISFTEKCVNNKNVGIKTIIAKDMLSKKIEKEKPPKKIDKGIIEKPFFHFKSPISSFKYLFKQNKFVSKFFLIFLVLFNIKSFVIYIYFSLS